MKALYIFSSVIFLTFLVQTSNAQTKQSRFENRYAVGLIYNPEWVLGDKYSPSFGLSGEAQFSEHSGIELNILYREHKWEPHGPGAFPITDEYFSIQAGYKFFSNILNFGVGLTADFSLDSNSDLYGVYLMVSKDIRLYKGLTLEPSLQGSPKFVVRQWGGYWGTLLGGGIKLKYRF